MVWSACGDGAIGFASVVLTATWTRPMEQGVHERTVTHPGLSKSDDGSVHRDGCVVM
jgi:hypothetical protein